MISHSARSLSNSPRNDFFIRDPLSSSPASSILWYCFLCLTSHFVFSFFSVSFDVSISVSFFYRATKLYSFVTLLSFIYIYITLITVGGVGDRAIHYSESKVGVVGVVDKLKCPFIYLLA